MKSRVQDCRKCRQQIQKQCENEFLKREYAIYQDSALTFATFSTAAVLMAMARRGRTKKYIQKLYGDIVFIYDTPTVFGKEIHLTEVMKRLEKDYDIDFSRINVRLETESEFIKSAKGAKK
jgi:hypothetical protein